MKRVFWVSVVNVGGSEGFHMSLKNKCILNVVLLAVDFMLKATLDRTFTRMKLIEKRTIRR